MHRAVTAYALPQLSPDDVVRQHSRLIDMCARRLANRTGMRDRLDDMWTAGAVALVEASRRFDGSRGVKFESFAEHRVRGAMLDELRRLDHLPRRLRAATSNVGATRTRLSKQLCREPTPEEMCLELGVDSRTLMELEAAQLPVLSLDDQLNTPGGGDSPEASAQRSQLKARVQEAVGAIPERLQTVLSLHYVEGLTYREIAHIFQVSEPRICQLHSQALRLVKEALGAE